MIVIDPAQIVQWLTAVAAAPQGVDWPLVTFVFGPIFPEHEWPEVLGVYTATPGLGEEAEGIVQRPGFQVRIRGVYEQVPELAQIADTIDRALMAIGTANLWGTRILAVDRSGGMPAPLVDDPENKRVSFTCNYLAYEAV